MQGDVDCEEGMGIIPRSVHQIFGALAEPDRFESSRVTVSYLEIYNEELFDLFVPPDMRDEDKPKLRIVEDKTQEGRGIYCMGLHERDVRSPDEVIDMLLAADDRRRIEETKMNKNSSRSHCLFTVCVTAREQMAGVEGGHVMERTGRLHLVDLAGSESTRAGGNEDRGRERKTINQSLLALGRVITALQAAPAAKGGVGGADLAGRVPYRDSKLTRLLQEALGGRSKTCILATCSPSELAVEETVSTLSYAQRACGIKNRPAQNQLMSGSGRSLSPGPTGHGVSTESWTDMELRLAYMDTQVREAQYELARQHEMQKDATARAAAAEEAVAGLEDAFAAEQAEVGRQAGRVSLLHGCLARRHVHVSELRHIVKTRGATEAALQEHLRSVLAALAKSVATSERLHGDLAERASEAEARRRSTRAFMDLASATSAEVRARVGTYVEANGASRAAVVGQLADLSSASAAAAAGLGVGLSSLEARTTAAAEALVGAVRCRVAEDARATQQTVDAAAAAAAGVRELVGGEAAGVGDRLASVGRDADASGARLLAWADQTAGALTACADGLAGRAERELREVGHIAAALDSRHGAALACIADEAAGLAQLHKGLGDHSAAAEAQAETAASAAAVSASVLDEARLCFEAAAAALAAAVASQRAGQGDAAALARVAASASAIARAAERSAAALDGQAGDLSAAEAALATLVAEQKAAHQAMVEEVVRSVAACLQGQASALGAKLDAAAEAISGHHRSVADANAGLARHSKEARAVLETAAAETAATVEAWAASDAAAAAAVDVAVDDLGAAQRELSAGGAALARAQQASATGAGDLRGRTADEMAAVAALRDSGLAAAAAGESARAATAEAVSGIQRELAEWAAADADGLSAALAAVDELRDHVRGDLERTRGAVAGTRAAATDALLGALQKRLHENHQALASSLAARVASWAEFGVSASKALTGDAASVAGGVAEDCRALERSAAASAVSAAASVSGATECLAEMGRQSGHLDSDVARLTTVGQSDITTFGDDVALVGTPVAEPAALSPVVFSDSVEATMPNEALILGLHGDNAGAMEASMFKRVATLLAEHAQAVERGEVPFHSGEDGALADDL